MGSPLGWPSFELKENPHCFISRQVFACLDTALQRAVLRDLLNKAADFVLTRVGKITTLAETPQNYTGIDPKQPLLRWFEVNIMASTSTNRTLQFQKLCTLTDAEGACQNGMRHMYRKIDILYIYTVYIPYVFPRMSEWGAKGEIALS